MWVSNDTAALFRDDAQERALFACFGVSIALHALLLIASPGLSPNAHPDRSKVLVASFIPRTKLAEAMPSTHASWKLLEKRREVQPQMSLPELSPAVAPQVAEATFALDPSPPSAAQALQSEASRVPEIASTEAAAKHLAEGFDAGVLDAYRLALIDAAKRYRRYPVHAMDRGWQGRVEVRVVIGIDGTIKRTHVKTSSSYRVLDEQALDMVKRGKLLTQVPSVLPGREFSVDIPVIFELQTG